MRGVIMKDLNKKRIINYFGFTLIELLAVIIILGVLLLISVPVISKYIENSRKETYVNTINEIVDSISNKVNNLEYMLPNEQEAIIVPFSEAELEKGTTKKSPFATYVDGKNYVIVTFNGKKYDYYVVALDEIGYAIPLVNIIDLNNKSITMDETKINNNIFSTDEIIDSSIWGEINTDSFSIKYVSKKDNIIKVKIGETSYEKGDVVQLKDGSKWYVIENSDSANKTVNLLSYNHMEVTEENYGEQSSSKYKPKTIFNDTTDGVISDGTLVWNNSIKKTSDEMKDSGYDRLGVNYLYSTGVVNENRLSFILTMSGSFGGVSWDDVKGYNFDAKTGELLTLDNISLDNDSFKNFVYNKVINHISNNYDKSMENYFMPTTRIERIVIKPDNTRAMLVIPMSEYTVQLKKGAFLAKTIKYRNAFKNRKITKVGNDYKITAQRFANADKEGLNCFYIITKVGNNYKIKTESWETKHQGFLK